MHENNFGNKIAALRKAKGYTQAYVAKALGVTPAAVSKWENSTAKPRVEMLFRLAELLEVNAKDLLLNEEQTPAPDAEEITAEKTNTSNRKPLVAVVITFAFVFVAAVAAIVYNLGTVTVPDLERMDCAVAEQMLGELGLEYQAVGEYSYTVEEDLVISQNVEAGTRVKKKSAVVVTVSKGTEQVAMPKVVGLPLVTARKLLKDLGFYVGVEMVYFAQYEHGIVVSQSIPAGQVVHKGRAIYIYVNEKIKQ